MGANKFIHLTFAVGGFPMDKTYDPQGLESSFGKLPAFKDGRGPRHITHNLLRAWDPIKQTTVWEHETSRDYLVYDGRQVEILFSIHYLTDREILETLDQSARPGQVALNQPGSLQNILYCRF